MVASPRSFPHVVGNRRNQQKHILVRKSLVKEINDTIACQTHNFAHSNTGKGSKLHGSSKGQMMRNQDVVHCRRDDT